MLHSVFHGALRRACGLVCVSLLTVNLSFAQQGSGNAQPVAGGLSVAQASDQPAGQFPTAMASNGVLASANLPAPGSNTGSDASDGQIRLQPVSYQVNQTPTADQFQAVMERLDAQDRELQALRQQQAVTIERLPTVQEFNRRVSGLEMAAQAARNKFPQVRLSGFFQEDTGFFSQDTNSVNTLGAVQNGTGFRRARLQALGNVAEFTAFSIEMDFAFAGRPSFMDVWLQQGNLPILGNVRMGQYRQPITMDSWTNIKHLEFLEQSAPFIAFDPYRRVGVMATDTSESQRTMWAGGIYGTGSTFWNTTSTGSSTSYSTLGNDNRYGTTIGSGISGAIRASHLVFYDDITEGRYLLHVGGGYNYSAIGQLNGTPGTFQARSIPEFFVGDQAGNGLTAAGTPNVIDTGRFNAHSYQLAHLELAGNYGSAHFQGELMGDFVGQDNGPTVNYKGAYFQCGYFLTGESCGYNKLLGAMDYNVRPYTEFFGTGRNGGFSCCGWGAWETAFRYSYLDLSSTKVVGAVANPTAPAGTSLSPNPGILNEYTGALNWWWNQYTRVQFNLIRSDMQSNKTGFNAMTISTVRFQVEF